MSRLHSPVHSSCQPNRWSSSSKRFGEAREEEVAAEEPLGYQSIPPFPRRVSVSSGILNLSWMPGWSDGA